jgi:hypothetical protein
LSVRGITGSDDRRISSDSAIAEPAQKRWKYWVFNGYEIEVKENFIA